MFIKSSKMDYTGIMICFSSLNPFSFPTANIKISTSHRLLLLSPKTEEFCQKSLPTVQDIHAQTVTHPCRHAHTVACTQNTQPETHVTLLTSVFLNLALRLFMFSPTHAVAHSIAQSRLRRRREGKKATQMFKLSLCDVSSHFKCDSVFLKTWFLGFL